MAKNSKIKIQKKKVGKRAAKCKNTSVSKRRTIPVRVDVDAQVPEVPVRKFGIKITLTRVSDIATQRRTFGVVPTGMCICGKTNEECSRWWDKFLGITGHSGDTGGGAMSEYQRNLSKQRAAQADGLDPYCFEANAKAQGYRPQWTPKGATGSLSASLFAPLAEVPHGPTSGESSGDFSGRSTGGSSGGRKRGSGPKSVRRQRR